MAGNGDRVRLASSALAVLLGLGLASCHTLKAVPEDAKSAGRALGFGRERPGTRQLMVMKPEQFAAAVNIDGRQFTSNHNSGNVYLDQPLRTGKHYWEVRVLCGPISAGVTNDLQHPYTYGGYWEQPEHNAGIYTWFAHAWPGEGQGLRSAAWRQRASTLNRGITPSGAVFGLALDADNQTLRTFWEGEEGPTLKLVFPGPYYAFSGTQVGYPNPTGQPCPGGPSRGEFMLAQREAKYPAPNGYRHLVK
jgi:predicted small secreted protein